MQNPKEKLASLTEIILSENENPGRLRTVCRELYDFFCEIAGLDDQSQDSDIQDGTILSSGKAISPVNAARCLWEYKRTTEFTRGVLAAIVELKKRFPREKIEIVYAGCGPFATLVTPLLDRFSPAEINLTLLDYHEFSLQSAKKIFRELELEKFAPVFVRADACTYQHPREIHLVITETMQNALVNETQTAITLNLAPQLRDGGIFVPQNISVEVCLVNFQKEFAEKERILLGAILELDAAQIKQKGFDNFPAVTIKTPAENGGNFKLMMLTNIEIFGSHRLGNYDSSITYPKFIRPLLDSTKPRAIEFSYILDEKPRFEHKVIGD